MKFTKKIILTVATMIVFAVACKDSFLEIPPTGALTETQLTSKDGLEKTLIGAYSLLMGRNGFYGSPNNWFWGSVLGTDANKGSDPGDQVQMNEIQTYSPQTTNVSILQKYGNLYEGVVRSNSVLKLLKNAASDILPADKTRIEAEARFLRALYYFDLKKIFNDTPYIDESWDERTKIPNNVNLWTKIEADFQFAYTNLPETQAAAGRANKWAAGAYLAKAYLFQKKFNEAKVIFDNVIANGKTTNGKKYGLVPYFANAFKASNDNHEESVFAMQAAGNTGDLNNSNTDLVLNFPNGGGPGGCCGFFQPNFDLANSYRTNATGLPLLDGSYNNTGNAVKSDMGLGSDQAFTPDAGNLDPRIDHTIGRRGIPYLDWGKFPGRAWIRNQPHGGPYAPKKWIYYSADAASTTDGTSWTAGYTALNVCLIRYADVLLMAAECEVEVGTLAKALEYVNIVRQRAANSFVMDGGNPAANYVIAPYTAFANQTEARNAVRMERKLELAMEGHRFYDLVRWEIAGTVIPAFLTFTGPLHPTNPYSGASFNVNKSKYLPIPQTEIDLIGSDVLKQNPGY
jgi:starch-binding outer membrane protein, SusD/RagB family